MGTLLYSRGCVPGFLLVEMHTESWNAALESILGLKFVVAFNAHIKKKSWLIAQSLEGQK